MKRTENKTGLSRLLAVLLTAAMLVTGLTACAKDKTKEASGGTSGTGSGISVSVKLIGPEETLLETLVTMPNGEATAQEAVEKACKDNNVTYTLKDGMFDNFGGVASTSTDGWLLYVGGALSDVGAGQAKLYDRVIVEFRYENYDTAFAG